MLDNLLVEEKVDPRVRRTLQFLEEAFSTLIDEKDFQSITIQDITERAGINRATFYAHFSDKYALLDYKIRQDFRAEIEKRTLSACHFSGENLRVLVFAVCEFVGTTNHQCKSPRGQFEPFMEAQVKGQVKDLLLTWLGQMEINSRVSPEIAATAASWAIYGLAQYWNREKERTPLDQFVQQILPLVEANLQ
jgi:AcrR family transcriptional regulator